MVAGRPLHIVRKRSDTLAMAIIHQQLDQGAVGIVLVEDGVYSVMPDGADVYVNDDDVTARGVTTPHRRIGYDEIARFVVNADTVMVW